MDLRIGRCCCCGVASYFDIVEILRLCFDCEQEVYFELKGKREHNIVAATGFTGGSDLWSSFDQAMLRSWKARTNYKGYAPIFRGVK